MDTCAFSEESARVLATKQRELVGGLRAPEQALAKAAAAYVSGLNFLPGTGELRLARASVAAMVRLDRAAWFDEERARGYVQFINQLNAQLQPYREFGLAFAQAAKEATVTLDACFAESAHFLQAATKWQTELSSLFDGQYAKSLQQMQSDLQKVVGILRDPDFPVRNIAHAALKNAEAFQLVNARILKEAFGSSRHVSELAGLPVAARYVVGYNDLLHTATLRYGPSDLRSRPAGSPPREEEIGPRLEAKIQELDPRLVSLRREAWENIKRKDAPALRLAAHGIREIFSEVLRRLAPDELVKSSAAWQSRRDSAVTRPTREIRFEFLLSSHPEKLAAVKQFARSLDKAHEFAHTFPEDQDLVRAYLTEVETCTYLLLIYGGR